MSWQTRSSRTVYENRWIRVREDQVLRPDSEPGLYGVLETRSATAFVVAVTPADELVLVDVDRYPTGQRSLEVPGGSADGDELADGARRELLEETGLVAERWRDLGPVFSLNGVARAEGRVFLAEGVRPDRSADALTTAEQRAEGIAECRFVPLADLPALIAGGGISDNESLGALLMALIALGRLR